MEKQIALLLCVHELVTLKRLNKGKQPFPTSMAESDKRNSVCAMTSSFCKQLYEVLWREEEKEGILGLTVLSLKNIGMSYHPLSPRIVK